MICNLLDHGSLKVSSVHFQDPCLILNYVFTEYLLRGEHNSLGQLEMTSVVYGWFLQATCRRLSSRLVSPAGFHTR